MANRDFLRRSAEHDKGEFRVTIVRQDGESSSRKIKSWKKALGEYMAAEKNPDNIFGIIRQGEGDEAGDIRHPPQMFSRDLKH